MFGVCTHATVEEGGDESLGGLSDDVVVEVLDEDNMSEVNICAMI